MGGTTVITPHSLESGLVGFWKFEEASGDCYSSGPDASFALTVDYLITYQAGGKVNYGINFNPDTSSLSRTSAASSPFLPYDKFTLSIWANFNATASTDGHIHTLVSLPLSTTAYGSYILQVNASDYVDARVYDLNKTAYAGSVITDVTIAASQWYHFVLVARGIGTYPKVFINGTGYVCTGNTQQTQANGYSSGFTVGNGYSGGSTHCNAIVDDFAFWTRNLSDTEVALLYGGGTPLEYPFTT